MSSDPECPVCGNDDTYTPRERICPFCGGDKCTQCDMGDDVPCMACQDDDIEDAPV